MYIVVLFIGIILGMALTSMVSINNINEMQGLIDASRKALAEAESKILERNKSIKNLKDELDELKKLACDNQSQN